MVICRKPSQNYSGFIPIGDSDSLSPILQGGQIKKYGMSKMNNSSQLLSHTCASEEVVKLNRPEPKSVRPFKTKYHLVEVSFAYDTIRPNPTATTTLGSPSAWP